MANDVGPGAVSAPPGRAGGLAIVQNAEVIARLYRRLVLLVGLQILLSILRVPVALASPAAALLVVLALLGTIVGVMVTAYQLTDQMGTGSPVLWALAMLVPCVNIISLLVLSSKAQTWCRQYDIKVGFLGPTRESIEDLRRRMLTSPFD